MLDELALLPPRSLDLLFFPNMKMIVFGPKNLDYCAEVYHGVLL